MHPPDDPRVTHKLGVMLAHSGFRVTWVGTESPRKASVSEITFVFCPGTGGSRLRRLGQGARLEHACLQLPDIATVDVFFAVEPDSAAVAIKLARRFQAKAVFDIHEMYHDEMLKRWVPRCLRPIAGRLVKAWLTSLCRKADLVMGPGVTRIAPYKAVARHALIARHCVPQQTIKQFRADAFSPARKVVRIMHGKATAIHGTGQVIQAVSLAQHRLGGKARLRVFCFDSFTSYIDWDREAFDRLVKTHAAQDMIEVHPSVNFSRMFSILTTCDIGVIAYEREFGVNCMPNRMFEYMAVGLPVIVPRFSVEMTAILGQYGCGLAVDTEDPAGIADAIVSLISDPQAAREMGERGRQGAMNELNMEAEIAPLCAWIRQACRQS